MFAKGAAFAWKRPLSARDEKGQMLLRKEKHSSNPGEFGRFNNSATRPWYPNLGSRVTLL